MKREKLDEKKHELWLEAAHDGERANLEGTDLNGADLKRYGR